MVCSGSCTEKHSRVVATRACLGLCWIAWLRWLMSAQIWSYEGNYTLWDVMQNKNKSREQFPYSMEETLFGEPLQGPKDARRRQASVRLVLQQAGCRRPHACAVWPLKPFNLGPALPCLSRRTTCLLWPLH